MTQQNYGGGIEYRKQLRERSQLELAKLIDDARDDAELTHVASSNIDAPAQPPADSEKNGVETLDPALTIDQSHSPGNNSAENSTSVTTEGAPDVTTASGVVDDPLIQRPATRATRAQRRNDQSSDAGQ